jgi:adenosylmethionine-8-amino-7-oxononanoate aminotransferase
VTELSAQLAALTPPQFNRFFYCSSGSEAIDTVIRLVTYYWQLRDKPGRNVIVSRRGAYHGSTVAAASVGGFDAMHRQAGLPVGNIFHAPRPAWWAEGGDLSPEASGEGRARHAGADRRDRGGARGGLHRGADHGGGRRGDPARDLLARAVGRSEGARHPP